VASGNASENHKKLVILFIVMPSQREYLPDKTSIPVDELVYNLQDFMKRFEINENISEKRQGVRPHWPSPPLQPPLKTLIRNLSNSTGLPALTCKSIEINLVGLR